MKESPISFNKKLLLVGSLSDFDSDIGNLLKQYCLDITDKLPELYHIKDYAAVVFSSSCKEQELPSRQDKKFFYLSFSSAIVGNIQILSPYSFNQFESALNSAIEFHSTKTSLREVEKKHLIVTKERQNLSEIGVALSAQKDLNKLLKQVLKEGRSIGKCEGASLYLVEKSASGKMELVFKLTQNSKISFNFREVRFPLTNKSLAGWVALSGEVLNIKDVYRLHNDYPFHFDKSFDLKANYRTKELLVLPMKNHKGKVIGVLQFINTFGSELDFCLLEDTLKQMESSVKKSESLSLGFSKEKEGLLMGLASQAAVAIDNNFLIKSVQELFEGFVSASIQAIESRDPVTSGHSFRVAELTTGLAEMLGKETSGKYKKTSFSPEQIKEIRYASLLHDFGKVGVKENLLLKANKLYDSRYQYLELKIDWQKQVLEKKYYQQLLKDGVRFEQGSQFNDIRSLDLPNDSHYKALLLELDKLEKYKHLLFQANQPSIMEQEISAELPKMAEYVMHKEFPYSSRLISHTDFLSLSIAKGSLTDQERTEIQSHVINTQKFLERIPWTEEFSGIPAIAAAHHEKLDGSGYPYGLREQEIPLPSKIMAIADIFDALTARDRPYKKAVSTELSLDILLQEANRGQLDRDILKTFIDSKIYLKVLQ